MNTAPDAVFRFDPETHTYWQSGARIPGITELLTIAGFIDKSEFEWYGPNASLRGKAIHLACELLDQKDLDWKSVTDEGVPYVMAYEKFLHDYQPIIDHDYTEKPRICPRAGLLFGGTPDRRMIVQNRNWIVDLKTGQLKPWIALQTAGQQLLMPEDDPFERYALQLKRDGTYFLKRYTDPTDIPMFKWCVASYWKKIQWGIVKENRSDGCGQTREESADDN